MVERSKHLLNENDLGILKILSKQDGTLRNSLKEELGLTDASLHNSMSRLIMYGFISMEEAKRYKYKIFITKEGRQAMELFE